MSIISFPYISILTDEEDPESGDRKVTAGQYAQGFALLGESGVVPGFLNELEASKEAGTMNILVATGGAFVAGHFIISNAQESVTLDDGDAQDRYDVIVCESNESTGTRAGHFTSVKGTPGESPEIPALTNSGGIEQIALLVVRVPAGATTLANATISDVRESVVGRHVHVAADIEGLATLLAGKLDASSYTAADVMTKVKANDGAGSGVDADMLDGQHASAFSAASHTHDTRYYTESEVDAKLLLKLTAPVSGGAVKFAATQPSMNVGDIWLKDLGKV